MWAYMIPNPFTTTPQEASWMAKTTLPTDEDAQGLKLNRNHYQPAWLTCSSLLMDPYVKGTLRIFCLVPFLFVIFLIFGITGFVAATAIISPLALLYIRQNAAGTILPSDWKYRDNLKNKTVMVVGGSSGIGAAIVTQLVEWNVKNLIVGCRTEIDLKLLETIKMMTKSNTEVVYERLDLSDKQSVIDFGRKIKSKFTKIDIIFNNSGIVNSSLTKTKEGRDEVLAVNYLGPFGISKIFLKELKNAGTQKDPSRIIFTNSIAYLFACGGSGDLKERFTSESLIKHITTPTDSYASLMEYGVSKFCSLLSMREMQNRLNSEGCDNVKLYAFHPGCVFTPILRKRNKIRTAIDQLLMKSPIDGAATGLCLATLPAQNLSDGGFYMDCREVSTTPETYQPDLMRVVYNDADSFYSDSQIDKIS